MLLYMFCLAADVARVLTFFCCRLRIDKAGKLELSLYRAVLLVGMANDVANTTDLPWISRSATAVWLSAINSRLDSRLCNALLDGALVLWQALLAWHMCARLPSLVAQYTRH